MKKDKTGVQLDLGHTSTDDFITEKYVLPLLRDEKMRNKLIEEHRACPVGKAAVSYTHLTLPTIYSV